MAPITALVFKRPGARRLQVDHGPLFYVVALLLYAFLIRGLRDFRQSRFPCVPVLASHDVHSDVRDCGSDGVQLCLCRDGRHLVRLRHNAVCVFFSCCLPSPGPCSRTGGWTLVSIARDLLYFNLADPVLVVNARGVVMGGERGRAGYHAERVEDRRTIER